jgi:hypothetical protein
MEPILGIVMLLILLTGGCCLFFLIFVQPIWGIVDVATSKEHSGGTKAAVILFTLLLLGPIMTFFYACIGTRSRILRGTTLISFIVVVLSGGSLLGLAIAVPALKQNFPWQTTNAANTNSPGTASASGPVEVEANSVDLETAPLPRSSISPASDRSSNAPVLQQGENEQTFELKSNIWQAIRTKNANAFVDCFFIEERFNTPEIRKENLNQIEILLKGETTDVEVREIPANEMVEIKRTQNSKANSPFRFSLVPKMVLRIRQKPVDGHAGRNFLIGEHNGKWLIVTVAGHTT